MAYQFIELEQTPLPKLIAHLAKQCGVEKEPGTERAALIDAILEFEELNGLARPVDLLPADMRPTTVIAASAELPEKLAIPIRQHPRVKIKINEDAGPNGKGDVYLRVNEYEAMVKRNTVVEVPKPVYLMLLDAVETKGELSRDGRTIVYREIPAYNVTFLGEVA